MSWTNLITRYCIWGRVPYGQSIWPKVTLVSFYVAIFIYWRTMKLSVLVLGEQFFCDMELGFGRSPTRNIACTISSLIRSFQMSFHLTMVLNFSLGTSFWRFGLIIDLVCKYNVTGINKTHTTISVLSYEDTDKPWRRKNKRPTNPKIGRWLDTTTAVA